MVSMPEYQYTVIKNEFAALVWLLWLFTYFPQEACIACRNTIIFQPSFFIRLFVVYITDTSITSDLHIVE
jgi:hypothetical protein